MHLIIFRKMLETTFRFWDSAGKAHPSASPPSMAMKIQWVREMLRRNRVMLIGASADPGLGNKGGGKGRAVFGFFSDHGPANGDGGDRSGRIGCQASEDRMSGAADADGAEVDRDDVEGGFGAAEEGSTHTG